MHLLARWTVVSLAIGAPLAAQDRPQPPVPEQLPRAVTREVARLYGAPHALRAFGREEIPPGGTVEGNLSVIDGPLILGGHVRGRVLAINADVLLQPGARIDGDLLVVGGEVEGAREARIGGEIRTYHAPLRFTRHGDEIILAREDSSADDDSWWRRWERRRARESRSRLVIASAGAYNRVEGLPINVGPSITMRPRWGTIRADAFVVLRTGSSFRSDTNDVGHELRLELRRGQEAGVRVGGSVFNTNVPVESWQLSPLEYGLAAFLFRRDYEDFYGRHGGRLQVTAFDDRLGALAAAYSHEHWSPRASHDPFTLFRSGRGWRENPLMDEGRMHILTASARMDTRNDDDRPWAGWFVNADLERGRGTLAVFGPTPAGVRTTLPGRVAYTRGFLDARRYNRVGPGAQLNFRVVAGGWLGGDALPLQRRVSVSGAGALPGFDFRTSPIGDDVSTCTPGSGGAPLVAPGRPASCDRILLAQAEYRGDLHFDPFGSIDWGDRSMHFRSDATWVVFADAGRGWLLGTRQGELRYGNDELPPPATYRTDAGFGLDVGEFGVFVAKALSRGNEPPNFLFRLRHRF